MEKFPRIQHVLTAAVEDSVFPGAVLLAAIKGEIVFLEAVGKTSSTPSAIPVSTNTVFDIASLTKPLATLLSMMILVDQNLLDPKSCLTDVSDSFKSGTSANTPIKYLLNHCGGMPDWRPYYKELPRDKESARKALRSMMSHQELEYTPGTKEIYSDPGFMLLGWLIEDLSAMPLDLFAEKQIYNPLGLSHTGFNPLSRSLFDDDDFAATEDCPWRGRVIVREVHDENAWAVGGVCGHAGLFSTAEEVYTLTRALPQAPSGLGDRIYSKSTAGAFLNIADLVANSDWWMGLMTPTPGASSAGKYFSPRSVGHLGYSGCSFWVDPEVDLTVVLLSNRVHPTRKNEKIKKFRPEIHNLLYEELIL